MVTRRARDAARRVRSTVSRATRDAICRLYEDPWDQPPPENPPRERAALDDDLIDDPAYRPEGGWLPATLAGVPRRPVPSPAAGTSSLDRSTHGTDTA